MKRTLQQLIMDKGIVVDWNTVDELRFISTLDAEACRAYIDGLALRFRSFHGVPWSADDKVPFREAAMNRLEELEGAR